MMRYLKRNKILFFLLFFTIISILMGIFFYANLDHESREVVASNLQLLLKGENISSFSFFLNRFLSNSLIWILGVSIIGVIIVVPLYFFSVFLFSFEFSSMVSILGFSKIFSIFLYFLPTILSIFCTFLLCFYSLCFSSYLFRFLFLHKNYSFSAIMRRYIKIYFLSLLGLLVSGILESLILSNLGKLFF